MEVPMSGLSLADMSQLQGEDPGFEMAKAANKTSRSTTADHLDANRRNERYGQSRQSPDIFSASDSPGPSRARESNIRSNDDFRENNPIKTILRSKHLKRKAKKLTDRRKTLITVFLKNNIHCSTLYGKIGSKEWTKELIRSLNERNKQQRATFADVKFWLNETTFFKGLLDRIPEWQKDSWLRSGYTSISSSSSPKPIPDFPTPENSDSGVGGMGIPSNEGGTDAFGTGMEEVAVAGPSRIHGQKYRLRTSLPPPPPLKAAPTRAQPVCDSNPHTPEESSVKDGQSSSESFVEDAGNAISPLTLPSVEQVSSQFAFVKDETLEKQEYNDISMNYHQQENGDGDWPNSGCYTEIGMALGNATTGDGFQLPFYGGHQGEGGVNLPPLPQADMLLNNYTNAMFKMVEGMRSLGYYGADSSINWDICYHSLKILILTTNLRK